MPGATGFGETDIDPPPVDVTDRTRHEPVSLEPSDDARESALAEVRGAGQLLHPVGFLSVLDQELPPGCRQRAILLLVRHADELTTHQPCIDINCIYIRCLNIRCLRM